MLEDQGAVEREEPAEVADADLDPLPPEPARGAEREVDAVPVGEERDLGRRVVEDDRALADRDRVTRRRVRSEPALVVRLVEVLGHVEGDRLEEDRDAAVHLGRRDERAEHLDRVVGPRGDSDDEAGDVAERGDGVVVVEVAAEALLVAEALETEDEAVPELSLGEERERARLAPDLVLGVVVVGEVLDLGDRKEPCVRRADREAEDRGLVEERVEDAGLPVGLLEARGHVVDAALLAHVLAEDEGVLVLEEEVEQGGIDRGGEVTWAAALGELLLAAPGLRSLLGDGARDGPDELGSGRSERRPGAARRSSPSAAAHVTSPPRSMPPCSTSSSSTRTPSSSARTWARRAASTT